MNLSFYSYLFLLILGMIENIIGEEDEMCDFDDGDYKTIRQLDGKIVLFKKDKYYTFSEGDIKNAEINSIRDLFPHTSDPIDECFVTNGKTYYLRSNKVYVNEGQITTQSNWNRLETTIDHLIIKKNGQTVAFFVPPKTSNNGFSRSSSRSNDLEIISFGGGSIASSSINGKYKIWYNGWRIPTDFDAFMTNKDKSLTFFKDNKYCIVKKNSKRTNFVWEDVKTLFGC